MKTTSFEFADTTTPCILEPSFNLSTSALTVPAARNMAPSRRVFTYFISFVDLPSSRLLNDWQAGQDLQIEQLFDLRFDLQPPGGVFGGQSRAELLKVLFAKSDPLRLDIHRADGNFGSHFVGERRVVFRVKTDESEPFVSQLVETLGVLVIDG